MATLLQIGKFSNLPKHEVYKLGPRVETWLHGVRVSVSVSVC